MPEHFGGTYGASVVDPLSLIVLAACIAYIMSCKRNMVLVPVLIVASSLSQSTRIVIATIDFSVFRIIVMFGVLRIMQTGEIRYFKLTTADKLLIAFLLLRMVVRTIKQGKFGIFVEQAGNIVDGGGIYLIARCTVRSLDDVMKSATAVATMAIMYFPLYMYENIAAYNPFSIIKGVDAEAYIRDGEVRTMANMPHPIVAGCYWAIFVPFYICGVKIRQKMAFFVLATAATVGIATTSSSSTPLFSIMAGFGGWVMFLVRDHIPKIRIAAVITLVALHFAMSMPVWHLIARVSLSSGSTAHFRYMIIDSFINRFNEWALLGSRSTAHWFFGAQDLTNQFVLNGVQGGLITLIVFIAQIVVAYKSIAWLLKYHRKHKRNTFIAWSLGVCMLVHLTNFFGISYFGQIKLLWFLLLGMIASVDYYYRQQYKRERKKMKQEAAAQLIDTPKFTN